MFGGFQHGKEVSLLGCPVSFRDADVADKGIGLEQLGTIKAVLLPDIGINISADAESQFPRLPLDGDKHLLQKPSFRVAPFRSQTQVGYAAEVNGNVWLISEMGYDEIDRRKRRFWCADHLNKEIRAPLFVVLCHVAPQLGVFAGETLSQRMENDKGADRVFQLCARWHDDARSDLRWPGHSSPYVRAADRR